MLHNGQSTGDPPEAWQAARRLRDGGMDRHDVLHELMAVAAEHLHPTLVRAEPFDVDAYRRALSGLGRDTAARPEPSHTTYQIKVSLAFSDPPIWRRLSLPGDIPLDALHHVIQVAFGWENDHLHEFAASGRRYADHGYRAVPGTEDERRATLAAAAPRKGDRLRYTYDFGDDWVHDIAVEAVEPAEAEPRVVCLAAENAGPPEDCGGIPATSTSSKPSPIPTTPSTTITWTGWATNRWTPRPSTATRSITHSGPLKCDEGGFPRTGPPHVERRWFQEAPSPYAWEQAGTQDGVRVLG